MLIKNANPKISGFQRPTLGLSWQFAAIVGNFIQILHVNSNHWVFVSSVGCVLGYVKLFDSLASGKISKVLNELVENLVGPTYQDILSTKCPVATERE